jgi:3-deoxy-D-manno-octulosonate 8-phosphate phosphatase (KDO 8-P phosphatase)
MTKNARPALEKIAMLVLDVDGVMTDGSIIVNGDGSESKAFNSLDGHGIRIWRRVGLKAAFLSGRLSQPTQLRAEQLEVDAVIQNSYDKLPAIENLLADFGLSLEQIAYIGDDLPDLPVIRRVGFGVAVANAVEEIKKAAAYVTSQPGGSGAVREVIEYILKNTGKWQQIMERYLL